MTNKNDKNFLAENMRRFRTKNLAEQVKPVSQMSNSELYNLVITLVKANVSKAEMLVNKMNGVSNEENSDINMLQTFVKSIKENKPIPGAEYIGKRLKYAEKYTQQLINGLQKTTNNFKPTTGYF